MASLLAIPLPTSAANKEAIPEDHNVSNTPSNMLQNAENLQQHSPLQHALQTAPTQQKTFANGPPIATSFVTSDGPPHANYPPHNAAETESVQPPLLSKTQPNVSFASALKQDSIPPAARLPTLPLSPASPRRHEGMPAVFFRDEEIDMAAKVFDFSLILKFREGNPTLSKIRSAIARWGLTKSFSVGIMDARHVLLFLTTEIDFKIAMAKEVYKIEDRLFRKFKWTRDFVNKEDSTIQPVWVQFHNLPITHFVEPLLSTVASTLGTFLRSDLPTNTLQRPKYARVCVAMDISRPLVEEVWIDKGYGDGYSQAVFYEHRPVYCSFCRITGHSYEVCRKRVAMKGKGPTACHGAQVEEPPVPPSEPVTTTVPCNTNSIKVQQWQQVSKSGCKAKAPPNQHTPSAANSFSALQMMDIEGNNRDDTVLTTSAAGLTAEAVGTHAVQQCSVPISFTSAPVSSATKKPKAKKKKVSSSPPTRPKSKKDSAPEKGRIAAAVQECISAKKAAVLECSSAKKAADQPTSGGASGQLRPPLELHDHSKSSSLPPLQLPNTTRSQSSPSSAPKKRENETGAKVAAQAAVMASTPAGQPTAGQAAIQYTVALPTSSRKKIRDAILTNWPLEIHPEYPASKRSTRPKPAKPPDPHVDCASRKRNHPHLDLVKPDSPFFAPPPTEHPEEELAKNKKLKASHHKEKIGPSSPDRTFLHSKAVIPHMMKTEAIARSSAARSMGKTGTATYLPLDEDMIETLTYSPGSSERPQRTP